MKRHSVHREHKDICLPAQQSLWPLRELILFPVVNLFIWLLRDKFDSGRLVHSYCTGLYFNHSIKISL